MRRLTAIFVLSLALTGAAARAESPDKTLGVEIVTAEKADLTRKYSLTGEIQARDSINSAFPIAGRLVEVLAEEGQKVKAGQVLARMDSVQQQQALRAAEAGLKTALADHGQADEDLARAEALLARGATTRASRDAAEDKLQIAAGALAQARADLDKAAKALRDTELTAPQDATVTTRMAEAGQVVGAAQPVLELALSNGVEAVFDVPEIQLTRHVSGEEISLARLTGTGAEFAGTVSEVSPLVDPATGTVAITVSISDPPAGLAYGEAVRGTATMIEPDKIVLPYTALSVTADGPAVWLQDPQSGRVSLRQIGVESYETGRIVVSDGVAAGDLVVARGSQFLYPGRKVRAVEAAR
ncbi:MAG: efflux RND transporter periplasmic adaptor subunit [Nitratireductor sp.]|nr:efflux RND transporter periplasmic adaptor subunit [Nitratireductor sp.]